MIEVNTGERVRLIGVDTLEEGECGPNEASQRGTLTLGETVTLTPGAQDDVDDTAVCCGTSMWVK
jgi:hypothetical protein